MHAPLFERDNRRVNAHGTIDGRQQHTAPLVDEVRIATLIADLGEGTFAAIAAQFCRDMDDALQQLDDSITASNNDDIALTLQLIRSCAANLGITRIVQICDDMRLRLSAAGDSGSAAALKQAFCGAKAELSGLLRQNAG